MVRFSSAECTEVLITHIASNSILTKMFGSLFTQFLTLFIFLIIINSTCLLHIHDVVTGTLDHIRIISGSDVHSQHFYLTPLLCRKNFFYFPLGYWLLTGCALCLVKRKFGGRSFVNLDQSLRRVIHKTRNMVGVKAVSWLEHTHFVSLLFGLGNHAHAEFAHIGFINHLHFSRGSSQFHHHLVVFRGCDLIRYSRTTAWRASKARRKV